MNDMKIPSFVTPPSIYHGWSTQKKFWEEIFTQANMKNCVHCNVIKHGDIKNGEQYIALDIYLKFNNTYKMKITSSDPNDYLRRSHKGLIASMGLKAIRSSKNI